MRARIEQACRLARRLRTADRLYAQRTLGQRTMKARQPDPVIAEVRAVRDEHAARFGYDLKEIFRDIRAMQKASGRYFVRYPARRITGATADPRPTRGLSP